MKNFDYPGFTNPDHHKHYQIVKKRYQLADNVYVFHGYSVSNFGVVIGSEGYVLVDTGSTLPGAEEALAEIKKITNLPLAGILLTHSHPDHRGGGDAFLANAPKDIPIWGCQGFGAEQAGFKGLEQIAAKRGGRQFGGGIPAELYTPNNVVPRFEQDAQPGKPGSFIAPNTLLQENKKCLSLGGVEVELYTNPGETTDHMIVWFPKEQVLFCGDTIYRAFPNLYPVRGAGFRDVAAWAAAARRLGEFPAKALVFGHNEPATGDEVQEIIKNYSAAIQYVYDETVKGMNQGLTPDELAATIRLPEELRNKPYLGEFYGNVAWSVRSIFSGLLGWFDGNATNLVPLAPREEAERMATLAGGADKLLEQAQKALADEDYRWAARLADYSLRIEESSTAKNIKADALEALSKIVLPIGGINYLLSSALELRK